MRKLALIAAPLVLAACTSQPAEEAPAEEAATAEDTEEAAPAMTTANGSMPGIYEVVDAEGTNSTSILNGDGTFEDRTADGELTAEGTWEVVDGQTCFTTSEEGAEAICWTESEPGEDGSFTATADDGTTVTVTPAAM